MIRPLKTSPSLAVLPLLAGLVLSQLACQATDTRIADRQENAGKALSASASETRGSEDGALNSQPADTETGSAEGEFEGRDGDVGDGAFEIVSKRPQVCPTDGWMEFLRTDPEALTLCADSDDPLARIFAAHALRAGGESKKASDLYRSTAEEESLAPIRSVLLVTAARALGEAGEASEAPELLETANADRGWLRAEIAAAKADLAMLAQRADVVRQQALEAIRLGHPAVDVLELAALKASVALEDRAGAVKRITDFRLEHPGSPLAPDVETIASTLGLPPPSQGMTPAELSRRWNRWIRQGGASGVAEECLPIADALGTKERPGPSTQVARALQECGRSLYIVRRPESVALFEKAATDRSTAPDALLGLARAHARGRDHRPVLAACERLDKLAPNSGQAADCRYLAAYLTIQYGDRDQGMAMLRSVASRHPNHRRGRDAAWMEAIETFGVDRAKARRLFGNIARSAQAAEDKAQALYWRGRTAESPEEAEKDWRQTEALDPWGYYGWLAAIRLGADLAPTPPDAACAPSLREENDEVTPPDSAKAGALLLSAGFGRFASLELDESLPIRRADSLHAAPFLARAQQYERLFRAGHFAGGERAPFPPSDEVRPAVEAAHPLAFPEALADVRDVNRCLVLSVMKRESLFAPNATSSAQARGLLQLLPSTAARVADELGDPIPTPEALHEPSLNVRLGSAYLRRLLDRFDHPLVAVAAYNAGPTAVAGWLERYPGLELDEWVERIPYRETRNYVKAVGGSFAAYSRLYGEGRPPLSLASPGPRPAGIDY